MSASTSAPVLSSPAPIRVKRRPVVYTVVTFDPSSLTYPKGFVPDGGGPEDPDVRGHVCGTLVKDGYKILYGDDGSIVTVNPETFAALFVEVK